MPQLKIKNLKIKITDYLDISALQPYAPAAFTPGEIPGLSRPQGTWFCQKEPRKKKSPVTSPGIDPGTVRLVAQRLDHYATPGPNY